MSRTTFFRTRVGARVLSLFFIGAILPVGLLAVLSHRAVTNQLVDQSHLRMAERTSEAGQWVLGRLSELSRWVSAAYGAAEPGSVEEREFVAVPGVIGVTEVESGVVTGTAGAALEAPGELEASETLRLSDGGAILRLRGPASAGRAVLAVPGGAGRSVWASLQLDSIWASALLLGTDGSADDICFLNAAKEPFVCLGGPESELGAHVQATELAGGTRGQFSFTAVDGEEILGSWREIYLRASFDIDPWLVATSERSSTVLAPASAFTTNFLAALAVGVLLVLFLANSIVRRTMEPLGALTAGTRALGARDLEARVSIESEDEFGELAGAFNSMAASIELQFKQLATSQAIDRAVVERGDRAAAIEALIDGLVELLPIRRAAVLLFDTDYEGTDLLCFRGASADEALETMSLPPLDGVPAWVPPDPDWIPAGAEVRRHLREAGLGGGDDHLYALPMKLEGQAVGVGVVSTAPTTELDPADALRANRLVMRAAVAVNEVRLRRELSETSRDALSVLANAIDAKSQWTAGHSQRVTALADAIGRKMHLSTEELDTLHRGGLLHDIGKIGVPQEILDFPGRLSDEQFAVIQTHPTIGVTILEPMKVFRPILPIVRSHHERWDGKGYPDGLEGVAIPRLARIMSVADVFDAMITPRPYRDALEKEFVVNHIRRQSEAMFDPEPVEAFLRVIDAGWRHDKVVPSSVMADVAVR